MARSGVGYGLGVDVGTTFTAAAVAEGGKLEIVQLGAQSASMPTAVFLLTDGERLVGEAAERRAIGEPGRLAREFKRRLGDPAPIVVGGTPFSVESLYAAVLRDV